MRLANLESKVFLVLVILTTLLFVWIVRGFLVPVFWAAVLATLFRPLFLRLLGPGGTRRGLAAGVATVVVILVVLIPSVLLAGAVAQEALGLYDRLITGSVDLNAPIAMVERWMPTLTDLLSRYGFGVEQVRAAVEGAAATATQYVARQALSVGQNVLWTAIMFGLMLYVLFFFFRDGDRIIDGVVRAVPMGDERERRLLTRFAEVSRATVKGTMIIAVVQGTLGGLMFSLVGLEAAVLWGVAMGVLSLLPAVGPALVWIPAAIVLLATGEFWSAMIVILGGSLVIGLVDNLLRPVLVGREAKLPDYLVLLATLGGISVFGIAGFVAGPVIAALFLVMWEMFADEYAPLDSSAPGGVVTTAPDPAIRDAPEAPALGEFSPEIADSELVERSDEPG